MNYKDFDPTLGPLVFQSMSAGHYGYLMKKPIEERMLSENVDALWWNNDLSKYKPYSKYWNTMLITGGHFCVVEDARKMFKCDEDKTIVFADSGGFQLKFGTGRIQKFMRDDTGDMLLYVPNRSNNAKSNADTYIRYSDASLKKLLQWQENNSDVFVNLDIPPNKKTPSKFDETLATSSKHFAYYANNRQKEDKILLNVLHGYNSQTVETWYDEVKKYPFDGWAFSVNASEMYIAMLKIATLLQNGEFAKNSCKVLHLLGATSMYYLLLMGRLQHHFNIYTNNRLQITCDSSNASLSGIYGRVIIGANYKNMEYVTVGIPQHVSDSGLYAFNDTFKLLFGGYDVSINNVVPDYKLHHHVSYNNIISIYKTAADLYELSKYPIDIIRDGEFMNPTYIRFIESIDEMMKCPEHAIDIAHKYKHVYNEIHSNDVSNAVDTDVLNSYFE